MICKSIIASYSLFAQKVSKYVIFEHLNIMIQSVEMILRDGCENGSFEIKDCAITARSLFNATVLPPSASCK